MIFFVRTNLEITSCNLLTSLVLIVGSLSYLTETVDENGLDY